MKAAVALCLVLALAGSLSASAMTDFCPESDYSGAWTELAANETTKVETFMELAVDEFVAANNTIPCPDTYFLDLIAGCSQVTMSTNYRLLFTVECEDPTQDPTALVADVVVPSPAMAAAGASVEVAVREVTEEEL